MSSSQDEPIAERHLNRQSQAEPGAWALWLVYGCTVWFIFAAAFFPEDRLWGINWYGYFSWYGPLILLLTGTALPLVLILRKGTPDSEIEKPFWPTALLLTALFGVVYVVFSARLHFLGDGYQLLTSLQSGVNHKPWESGTFLIQKWVYAVLGSDGEKMAEFALQIVSYASGIAFVLVSALASVRLFSSYGRRVLYFLGVNTGGYALLFFGYLESYPLFVLTVGSFFQIGLLVSQDKLSRWLILPLLGAAAFFHIFTVALLPGALYLFLRGTPTGKRIAGLTTRVKTALVATIFTVCAAVFLYFYINSYFFRFTIVSPYTSRFTVEGYNLFSGKHLLDYVNHFFQLFPGLAVVLAVLWLNRKSLVLRRPEITFTLLTLLPSMGLVFIFNPGLGFPRDWDLFSFVGIPLVCGAFYVLLNERCRFTLGKQAAVLTIGIGCLLLAPRVATQAIPDKAISVFNNYAALDVIRNETGRFILLTLLEKQGRLDEKAERERQNVFQLPHQIWYQEGEILYRDGKMAQAEQKFRRSIEYAPSFAYAWANIGVCFSQRKQWDSALVYFQIADALNPFNSDTYNSLGWVYLNQGDTVSADKYWLKALRLSPVNFLARANLVNLYRQQNRRDEMKKLLIEVLELTDVPSKVYYESAEQLLQLGDSEAASRICRRALDTGVDRTVFTRLETEYPGFKVPVATQ